MRKIILFLMFVLLSSFVYGAELVYYNESFFINANQETFLTNRTFFGIDIIPAPYNIVITEIEKYPECQASYVDQAYVCIPDYCPANNIYYFDENNKVYPNYNYNALQDTLLLFFTNQTGFYNMTQRNYTDFLITDLIAGFSVFGDPGNTTAFYNNYDYDNPYTYYCLKSFNYSYYAYPPTPPPQNQTGNFTGAFVIQNLSGLDSLWLLLFAILFIVLAIVLRVYILISVSAFGFLLISLNYLHETTKAENLFYYGLFWAFLLFALGSFIIGIGLEIARYIEGKKDKFYKDY